MGDRRVDVSITNKPFGTYCISTCTSRGMKPGLSSELQCMVLGDSYRDFVPARAAILDYMGNIYSLQDSSITVTDNSKPALHF